MANAGVSQEVRMKLTGHISAEMNRAYTHHELEPLRAAVALIPRSAVFEFLFFTASNALFDPEPRPRLAVMLITARVREDPSDCEQLGD
jgi:hypothetical protein